MSLHFVIDGYNLIKRSPLSSKASKYPKIGDENRDSLEDLRAALIRFIKLYRPQGKITNRITIVFDAKDNKFYEDKTSSDTYKEDEGIGIIFSKSADDKIKRLVKESVNPKNIVVVTDDRDIQFFVRQYNAKVKTTEEFLRKHDLLPAKVKPDDKMPLSPQEAIKITEEMKMLWLKKQ